MLKREGRYLSLIPKDIEVIDLEVTQARFALFKIIRVIRAKKPDVVFTTLAYLNLIIALLRPFFSKKTLFIARESNTVSIRNKREKYPKLFDWLYKNFYKNFDVIVTQAEFMKQDLVKNYGIDAKKMVIIYNPVDSALVAQKADETESVQLPKVKCNLLCVGKLGYQKGYDMMLPIMTRLDERYHLTILGEGADKSALLEQCEALGLNQRVTFAGFCDNPYAYMKKCDLLLLPSRYEGLPNVVLEAQVCGLPTVAFNSAGGTGEIIQDGFNGFLVPPFDEEAFAKSIENASDFSFNREKIKEHVKKHYAVSHIIKSYEILLLQSS
jgi:glycosyltransferase involved in cell wall biosynthesis